MTKGQKVKSVYGERLTVMSVNGNMVKVYEDATNLYHITKLIF